MGKCKNKAVYQYAWAGEIKKCCGKHGKQIQMVGSVIGSPVNLEPILTDEKCPNVDE